MGRFIAPLVVSFLAFVATAQAEQSVSFDGYVVHYNAYTSDMLDPKVASDYGITRSHNRGVLLVNVQPKGAKPSGIRAKVEASAQTVNLQGRTIDVREVKEGDVYYYLADFPVNNGEILDFKISVSPEGRKKPYEFSYRHQFFTRD